MEAAHEIGQVGEAGFERDLGDRRFVRRQHARRAAQARAQQVLVRRHPDHAREQAQEMPGAQAGLRRGGFEVDVLVCVIVQPQRALTARRRSRAVPATAAPAPVGHG
jgi:hypothetical protein